MKMARDYGVLLEDEGVALRGLFLIDPKGTLRQITINDLAVGRSVDETIRLIKAFQFVSGGPLQRCESSMLIVAPDSLPQTDEHGEVCPANWDPESNNSTIK